MRFLWRGRFHAPGCKVVSKALEHCSKGFFRSNRDIQDGMSDDGEVERLAPGAELGGLLVQSGKSHGFCLSNPPEPLSGSPRFSLPACAASIYPPSALFVRPKKRRVPVRLWRTSVLWLAGRHDSRREPAQRAGVAFCLPSFFGSALGETKRADGASCRVRQENPYGQRPLTVRLAALWVICFFVGLDKMGL